MEPVEPVEPPLAIAAPLEQPLAIAAPLEQPPSAQTPNAPNPNAHALDEADRSWFAGDRRAAVHGWKRLLTEPAPQAAPAPTAPQAPQAPQAQASTDLGGDALEAMVRMRLLQVAGNLGPLWLEAPLDRALFACSGTVDRGDRVGSPASWCRIADADYELWMPKIAGADPRRIPDEIGHLKGWAPADARLAKGAAASAPNAPGGTAELAAPAARVQNPWPGTWVLGWGFSVAPGAGVGAGLHFVHPDLGWEGHRLALDASGDTLGGFWLQAGFSERASPRSLVARAAGGNLRGAAWDGPEGDEAFGYALHTVQGSAGVASTHGRWVLAGGGEARWDSVDGGPDAPAPARPAVGPWASLRWSGPVDLRVSGDVNGVQGAPPFALGSVDVRRVSSLQRGGASGRARIGTIAMRAVAQVATDGPFYRLPSAGGSTLLRGEPAGRYRGPLLAGLQVEYRRPLYGPIHAALFVDSAFVTDYKTGNMTGSDPLQRVHISAGAGVRLVLPPADVNVTRVDVGVAPHVDGTVSWGVVVGWGEAF